MVANHIFIQTNIVKETLNMVTKNNMTLKADLSIQEHLPFVFVERITSSPVKFYF